MSGTTPVPFEKSRTKVNLMRAFAGESQARNRYTFAAQVAKAQKQRLLEQIFTFTANQEKEHAQIFWNLMSPANGQTIYIDGGYPVELSDDLATLLRSAQHNEYEEHQTVYPEFSKIAQEEGFTNVAYAFREIAQVEKTHGNRFGAFAELIEQGRLHKGPAKSVWMCMNCGYIYEGTDVPEQCPVCLHDKGYFVPFQYYNFTAANYTGAEQS